MNLTGRQRQIYDILEDALGSGDTITQLAIRIDRALPALPAPEQGHLPAAPPIPVDQRWTSHVPMHIVVDLEHFYEDVVMPSRERYMNRNQGRRGSDKPQTDELFDDFVTKTGG